MSRRVVLITGTDTGVGKTVVACGLGRLLARDGVSVVAVKPVESGCGEVPGGGEDGVLLAEATGQDAPQTALVRLRTPVAPPVAAEREGVELDMNAWCKEILALAKATDVLLVEGAGGLLSPLTWEASALDLATSLETSVIVVAPDRLGSLNHTLLTIEVLESADVPLLGVVFVAPESADESTGTNADSLRRVRDAAPIAVLPRVGRIEDAAEHLQSVAEWVR